MVLAVSQRGLQATLEVCFVLLAECIHASKPQRRRERGRESVHGPIPGLVTWALFKGRHQGRTGWSECGIAITDGGNPTLLLSGR